MGGTGLALLSRTSCRRTWNLASYHHPRSLTWSWILSFSFFAPGEWRVWPLFSPFRTNCGLQWTARIPFVGFIRWHCQQPMYR